MEFHSEISLGRTKKAESSRTEIASPIYQRQKTRIEFSPFHRNESGRQRNVRSTQSREWRTAYTCIRLFSLNSLCKIYGEVLVSIQFNFQLREYTRQTEEHRKQRVEPFIRFIFRRHILLRLVFYSQINEKSFASPSGTQKLWNALRMLTKQHSFCSNSRASQISLLIPTVRPSRNNERERERNISK